MNSVTIVGRTGKEPETKWFDSGKVRTTFSVAVDRWDSVAKEKTTDWYNIDVWDKLAEFAGEYVKKGRMVAIDGRLTFSRWTAPSGEQNERFIVRANNIRLIGGRSDDNQGQNG